MPGSPLTAWLRPLLTVAAMVGVLSLAGCGGGGGAPNNPYQPGAGPLTVTPASGNGYSGVPFSFSVTGGTAPYSAISSDQVLLPVPAAVSGNTLVVLPGSVAAATSVSFTVRDSAGHQAAGSLTINPALLLPASITITGNPNCASSGATLCSGQDGSASVTVTGPGGAPIPGRAVRFDVAQGDFSISPPGQASVPSLTVTTDQNGNASVRLLVSVAAPTQIASIRATDVTSGSNVLGQFTIAQFVNGSAILTVLPSGTTTFTGPDTVTCNAGGQATFYIFGGTPPYTVETNFPQAVLIRGATVLFSGGAFSITMTGVCVTNLTFIITDATGRVLTSPPTVDNVVGTAAAPPPALLITPSKVSATCAPGTTPAQFVATGGTGTYVNGVNPAAGPYGTVTASPSGANVNVSFPSTNSMNATGMFDVTVTSGTQAVTAVLTCN